MKHYTAKSTKCVFNVEEYTSANELVNTLKTRQVTNEWKGHTNDVDNPNKSFAGVGSYKEALNLLNDGWSEKVNEMKTLTNKVTGNAINKRVSFQNNVVGFAPIVPLALMNVPNSMIDSKTKPIKSKVVKIIYNITVSWSVDTNTILKNGMKVVEAIINLERSGYRCELIAMQNYYDGNVADTLLVKIKEANQPIDLKRIMFPLIHPAMFRVIGFDWQDKLPSGKYMNARGHAIGYTFKEKTPQIIKEAFGDNCFYLDNTMLENEDESYVEKVLKGETNAKTTEKE